MVPSSPGWDYSWKGTRREDTAGRCPVAQSTGEKTSAKILSKTLRVLLSQVFFITPADQVLTFFPSPSSGARAALARVGTTTQAILGRRGSPIGSIAMLMASSAYPGAETAPVFG